MDERAWEVSWGAALRAAVPETLAEAEQLAASIEAAVRRETSSGVRNLSVSVGREGILLQGTCASFYCKQLAQQAAMVLSQGDPLTNRIEVHGERLASLRTMSFPSAVKNRPGPWVT